jgi:hypothetical protein
LQEGFTSSHFTFLILYHGGSASNARAEEGKKTQRRRRAVNQETTDLQVMHPVLTLSFFLCDRGGVVADMLVLESVDRGDPVRRLEESAYIGRFEIAKKVGEAGGDLQN